MKEESDHIDKLFRDKLANAESQNPLETWSSVKERLFRNGLPQNEHSGKYKRRSQRIISFVLVMLFFFSVSFLVKDTFRWDSPSFRTTTVVQDKSEEAIDNARAEYKNTAWNNSAFYSDRKKHNRMSAMEGSDSYLKETNGFAQGAHQPFLKVPAKTVWVTNPATGSQQQSIVGNVPVERGNERNSYTKSKDKKEEIVNHPGISRPEIHPLKSAENYLSPEDRKHIAAKIAARQSHVADLNSTKNKQGRNKNGVFSGSKEIIQAGSSGSSSAIKIGKDFFEGPFGETKEPRMYAIKSADTALIGNSSFIDSVRSGDSAAEGIAVSKLEEGTIRKDRPAKTEILLPGLPAALPPSRTSSERDSFQDTIRHNSSDTMADVPQEKQLWDSRIAALPPVNEDSLLLDVYDTLLHSNTGKKKMAKKAPYPGISIGAFLLPGMSEVHNYQNDKTNGEVKLNDGNFHGILDGGISINIHLSNRFFLGTGIISSSFTQKLLISETKTNRDTLSTQIYNPVSSSFIVRLNDSSVFNPVANMQSISVPNVLLPMQYSFRDSLYSVNSYKITKYQYVGIPVLAGAAFGKGRLQMSIFAGMVMNLPVSKISAMKISYDTSGVYPGQQLYVQSATANAATYTTFSTSRNDPFSTTAISSIKELSNINWMFMGGANVHHQLSKSLSLSAGPLIRYSLNSVFNKREVIKVIPYSLSFQVGLTYRLR
jgi:hypothetical protein